ncbi:MAG: thiamine phosphate synthase [Gammaproteobacteria bacterium]
MRLDTPSSNSESRQDLIGITGDAPDYQTFCTKLQTALDRCQPLAVLYRARHLPIPLWKKRCEYASELCSQLRIPLILAVPESDLTICLGLLDAGVAQGVHLSSSQLYRHSEIYSGTSFWLGASCHNLNELQRAEQAACTYATISPVRSPLSHSSSLAAIGLDGLSDACRQTAIPLYALGGLAPTDLPEVKQRGAQGIAGISWFWPH